jgi:hypothetical protein
MRDKGATRDWCGRAYDRQRASGRSRLTAEFSVGRTLGGKPPLNSSPWRRDPWRRGLFSGGALEQLAPLPHCERDRLAPVSPHDGLSRRENNSYREAPAPTLRGFCLSRRSTHLACLVVPRL